MSIIFASGTSGTIGKHFGTKVSRINCDLSNSAAIAIPLLKPGDSLLHAAAIVGPMNVAKDINLAHLINVQATKNLAQIAKDNGVSKFVFVSTSHVYRNSTHKLTESSQVFPSNIYSEQKLEAEEEVRSIFIDCPEKLCIVRVFSVLDWDVAEFTLGGGIKKLMLPDSLFVLQNADDVRDFLTPRQIAFYLIAITNQQSLNGVVNLSTGIGTSVREAARIMLESTGYKLPTNRIIPGNSDYPYVVGDNSKLKIHIPGLEFEWRPSPLPFN